MGAHVKVVCVSSLPASCTDAQLRDFFAFHGKIERAVLLPHEAYLEFARPSAASSALLFDKANFLGATIRVTLSSSNDLPVAPDAVAPPEPPTSEPAASKEATTAAAVPAAAAASPAPPPPVAVAPPPRPAPSRETTASAAPAAVSQKKARPAPASAPAREPARVAAAAPAASQLVQRRRECVQALLAEPLNGTGAILGVTIMSLALIAVS